MASRPSLTPRAVARRVKQLTTLQYQLRIELSEVQPLVWRRLFVPENLTLPKLSLILQTAMGWAWRSPTRVRLGSPALWHTR
ncbi:MAG: IS1096 element passenger TnpR family protein [Steroidobacteraceae bacterium]